MEDSPEPKDQNQPEHDAPVDTPAAGSNISPDSTPPTTPEPPAQTADSIPVTGEKPKRSSGKKMLTILLILIVIVALAAGAYLLYKPTTKTANNATSTKHDITVLRYGEDSGEVPNYPVNILNSSTDAHINMQLFEGLVGYQDQTKIIPLLATGWSNPNDSTWLFTLRHNVKFHSGRIMTATDVKASLDYAIAHQNDNDGSSALIIAETLKQVDIVNPYEVKITTNGPDPTLLGRLVQLGIFDSKAKLGDYDAGTAPYIVKPGTTPDSTHIKLVAFKNYWGGHVYSREVDITIDSDQGALATAAANGQYDIAGDFYGADLAKFKHYTPLYVPDEGVTYLGPDSAQTTSLMHNLAARQAVSYALNVPDILKSAGLRGTIANQMVPLQLPGHDPSIPTVPYNPTKAKELLASVPNNKQEVTFGYPEGDDAQANLIVKELTAVGFNIKPILQSNFDQFITDSNNAKYDLFYISDSSNVQDGLDILSTTLTGVKYYDNPDVDQRIESAGQILDSSNRIKEMQQIAQIIYKENSMIPLFNQTRVFTISNPSYVVKSDIPGAPSGILFYKVYQK